MLVGVEWIECHLLCCVLSSNGLVQFQKEKYGSKTPSGVVIDEPFCIDLFILISCINLCISLNYISFYAYIIIRQSCTVRC